MRPETNSGISETFARCMASMTWSGRQWSACALAYAVVLLMAFAAPSAQAQTFTLLHTFTGSPTDGGSPESSLIMDAKGNLYGAAVNGGNSSCRCGAVFKLAAKSHTETLLYSFQGLPDGIAPYGGVAIDAQGNVYGTTYEGGTGTACGGGGCGTVFKISKAGKETVLHSFAGGSDGSNPTGGVVLDAAGNLYGTTSSGGTSNSGTVFEVTKAGKETVMHTFTGSPDGSMPYGTLIIDAKGTLYGTTLVGGTGAGTVFKVTKSGKETVFFDLTYTDGIFPYAGVVMDLKGNLYGEASTYGAHGGGTVFKVTKSGTGVVLYDFTGVPDGSNPFGGLVLDKKGNLYGTTRVGGSGTACSSGCGTVFKVSPAGTETVLYNFTGGNDGATPFAGLVMDTKGNLYGATEQGGADGYGTVFKLTP